MRTVVQVSRFVVVGVVATAVHFGLLFVLVHFHGLDPTPATVIGSAFGTLTSYAGNHRYVFASAGAAHGRFVPRFVLAYALIMGIHAGVMALFTRYLGIVYPVAFLTALVLSATLSFLANRFIVFVKA